MADDAPAEQAPAPAPAADAAPATARKTKKWPQFLAALSATFGGFSTGCVIGWSSPAQLIIEEERKDNGQWDDKYDPIYATWYTAVMPLGAMLGLFICMFIIDRVGRKWTLIGAAFPMIGSWIVLALGLNKNMLLIIGRILGGMSGGSYCVVAPLYSSEVTETKVRGMLGVSFQMFLVIGIMYAAAFGLLKKYMLMNFILMGPIVIFIIIFFLMPETPYFLISKDKTEAALKSLQWLRGKKSDVRQEFSEIESIVKEGKARKQPIKKLCTVKANKRSFLIAMMLMFNQQLSGINVVMFNAGTIFKDAGSEIDPLVQNLILGCVQVVATVVAALIVDRVGRRILLLISHAFMGLFLFALGAYFFVKEETSEDEKKAFVVPVLALSMYLVAFSLGSGPLPWAMLGEVFPDEVKGKAANVCGITNWFLAFATSVTFQPLVGLITMYGVAFTYGTFCFISTVLIFFFIIETKGKTFAEIQDILEGNDPDNAPVGLKK